RGQLFHVAIVGSEISDGNRVAQPRHFFTAAAADRRIRIIADLAAEKVRHLRIQQRRHARRMRLLAWPRKPSRMKLCRERTAFTICGTTVSSYPTMPGNTGLPERTRAIRLSRISSFTRRLRTRGSENCWLRRSSPNVCGRLLKDSIPPRITAPIPVSGLNGAECSYSTPAVTGRRGT